MSAKGAVQPDGQLGGRVLTDFPAKLKNVQNFFQKF